MSSFFDKVKQGVSDTGAKAKVAMEVQKLKGQISGKLKDINGKYFEIGKLTYQAFKNDDFSPVQAQIEAFCSEVTAMLAEIDQFQAKINELEQEGKPAMESPIQPGQPSPPPADAQKTCTCGTVVAPDARFCPECGTRFA